MGTKMGPSYANLFIGFIEHQFFRKIRLEKICQFFDQRGYPVSVVSLPCLSLLLGSSESLKTLEKNLSLKSALLIPTVSTSAFHLTN